MSENAARTRVLIVDDERQVRDLLGDVFSAAGYQCRVATNGQEGIEAFRSHPQDLAVTDIRMPVLDGLGFLQQALVHDPDAAVIVLTGVGDVRTAVQVLKDGAYDFIMKPVNPEELLITAGRALERRQLIRERRHYQELLESRVMEATSELAASVRQLEETYLITLEALGSAIDTRDVGTHAHSRRVRGYSLAIARAHGVPIAQLLDIEHGVLLHDIGKIGIPDAILLKPGPLTPDEWKVMRTHPEIGRRLIERIPFLRGAVPIVYHHHERWDGTGYPMGLRGEGIPLGARIFAVADALDAMTFDRPYSRAIAFGSAQVEITRCAGTHFDPAVVDTFLTIPLHTFEDIRHRSLHEMSAADAAAEAVRGALASSGPALAPVST